MADFTSNVAPVNIPQSPNIVVPADTSTANAIQSGGNILGAIGQSLAQGYAGAQLEKQNKESGRINNQLAQNLLRVADLEQSGFMKPDVAARQYRIIMARNLANNYANPALTKQLLETYQTIVKTPGLGENIAKDFQQEKDNQNDLSQQALKSAQAAGFGSPDMTPDMQQFWAEKHQPFLFGQTQMNAANAILEHKIKENNLVTSGLAITSARQGIAQGSINIQRSRIGLAEDQAQLQFMGGVQNMSDAWFPKFSQTLEQITADVKAGKITKEDAIRDIQTRFAGLQQQVSSMALASKQPGMIDGFIKPFEMLTQRSIDQINGKTLNTVATNDVGNITLLQQQLLSTQNPDFARLAAVSKMVPAGAGALQTSIGNATIDMLKKGGQIPNSDGTYSTSPPNVTSDGTQDGNKAAKDYYKLLKRAMITSDQSNDPDLSNEVDNYVANTLRGIGVYGGTAQNPANLSETVKFLASPEFAKYVKDHPDSVTGDNAQKAKQVYKQEYEQKVLPLIQDQFTNLRSWSNATIQTGTQYVNDPTGKMGSFPQATFTPTAELIQPTFNGAGVSFVADPRVANMPQVKDKVRQLNSQLAPVMTTLIRANANLANSGDYKQAYDAFMTQYITAQEGSGQ